MTIYSTKMNEGLLEMIEKNSGVRWAGPSEYKPTEYPPPRERFVILRDDKHLTHHNTPVQGSTYLENDEFVAKCAEMSPKSVYCTRLTSRILYKIEKASDVKWCAGKEQPTEYIPLEEKCPYLILRGNTLSVSDYIPEDCLELLNNEFIATCADASPKPKATFREVCLPVIQWIRDNSSSLAINIDAVEAKLYDPTAIRIVKL